MVPALRRLHLGRIRYFVYYQLRGDALVVLSVWHTNRGNVPALWAHAVEQAAASARLRFPLSTNTKRAGCVCALLEPCPRRSRNLSYCFTRLAAALYVKGGAIASTIQRHQYWSCPTAQTQANNL